MPRIRVSTAASIFSLVALTLAPIPGRAEPVAHLAWDDCGAAGAVTRTFACNTNLGADELIVSFVPPAGITAFVALEAKIQLWPPDGNSALLPPWWGLFSGGCRPTSLSAPVGFAAGPFTCADPWTSSAAGGTALNATTLAIGVVAAVPSSDAHPLDPTTEYYGLRVRFNHTKSTGTGACGGCSTPIGMYLSYLKLDQYPSGVNDYTYDLSGRSSGVIPYANWQCDGQPVFQLDPRFGWFLVGWSFPCLTPAQRQTWGQIKALYR